MNARHSPIHTTEDLSFSAKGGSADDSSVLRGLVTRYLAEPELSVMLRILAMAQRVVSVVANTTIGDALSLATRLVIVVTPLVWLFTSKQS